MKRLLKRFNREREACEPSREDRVKEELQRSLNNMETAANCDKMDPEAKLELIRLDIFLLKANLKWFFRPRKEHDEAEAKAGG